MDSNDQDSSGAQESPVHNMHNPPPTMYCSGIRRVDPVGEVSRFEPIFVLRKDGDASA